MNLWAIYSPSEDKYCSRIFETENQAYEYLADYGGYLPADDLEVKPIRITGRRT